MKNLIMRKKINIALVGNPNAGKTTLFNAITGARQHTGNWPGVTVEKKEGNVKHKGHEIQIVDLPGTYSLTAYSLEEKIVRSFIIEFRPDVIVDVVDSSNIERNLYLAVQLLEMGVKVVIALNMMDVAHGRGIKVDANKLSRLLQAPVIHTNGKKKIGIRKLLNQVIDLAKTPVILNKRRIVSYEDKVKKEIVKIENNFDKIPTRYDGLSNQWLAVKLLEKDEEITREFHDNSTRSSLIKQVQESRNRIQNNIGETPELILTTARYTFISTIIKQAVQFHKSESVTLSESIDRVLTHRLFGPTIMLAALYLVYMFTFQGSEPIVNFVEGLFSSIGGLVTKTLPEGPLQSLLVSGIINGVGGVLGFTPLIAFMFLAITFLEDTGYMARIAFMLDRILHSFGLHGTSMLALMVSGGIAGGCAVPGIMATRTMREPKERLVTILVAPLMNCGAKLPIYALLIGAFFPGNKALMMLILTIISWAMALLAAKIMRLTILSGIAAPFILELPPYRMPTIRGLITNSWERTWMYIRKAGTVILTISIILWAMMNYPSLSSEKSESFMERKAAITSEFLTDPAVNNIFKSQKNIEILKQFLGQEDSKELKKKTPAFLRLAAALNNNGGKLNKINPAAKPLIGYIADAYLKYIQKIETLKGERQSAHLKNTVGGKIGLALEIIFKPIGFDWKTNVALVGGFAAKEVVVSTLGTAYSLADVNPEMAESLSERLKKEPGWNPVLAFSLIMFVMLYSPCFATLVMIKKETGKWRWVFFAIFYTTTLAYLVALGVRIVATLLGLGVS